VVQPPVEPPVTSWRFGDPSQWPADDLVGVGADLSPGTVLAAYRAGLFPMQLDRRRLGWWSPMARGVLPLDALVVTKSLRRSCRRYVVSMDQRFAEVMQACGSARRDGNWITPAFVRTYTELHRLGWAHSVEVWEQDPDRDGDPTRLVGGLYGLHIAGLFAGESMFHTATDASKVALVALVEHLRSRGIGLLETQWSTPHLASLGVQEIDRTEYLDRLAEALGSHATWAGDQTVR
jgi:leucyl/phenylalanyl-tRNA--protein transferase